MSSKPAPTLESIPVGTLYPPYYSLFRLLFFPNTIPTITLPYRHPCIYKYHHLHSEHHTEIKLQILYKILDVKSLSSLVHACPTMHAVYASDRQRILTSATLKEMVAKRVDIFTPAPLLEVRLVNDPYLVSETLRLGIESLYSQLSTPKAKITLTVDHCKWVIDFCTAFNLHLP